MLTFHIVCAGQLRESYLRLAASEYEKRLSGDCRIKTTETDDAGLLGSIPPRAYKIALCVEGVQLSSEELASRIDAAATAGNSVIVFVIGGADGLPETVKQACDFRLSFSRMTFPHRLMRILLLEQLYRAVNITKGGKYHH